MFRSHYKIIISLTCGFLVASVGVVWVILQLMSNPVDELLRESSVFRSAPEGPGSQSANVLSHSSVSRDRTRAGYHGEFLGSNACRECHAEIATDFLTHPMASSLAVTTEADALEDYSDKTHFQSIKSAFYDNVFEYRVKRDEDAVHHQELVLDHDGNLISEVSMIAEFAVGSGRRGRSYLLNHDGLLYMSPITWYSHESCWDLSPAYSKDNQHFERRIVDGCVACHAGRTAFVPGKPNHFEKNPFHELSIGCERCHGPGETHVTLHQERGLSKIRDEVVNPARFDTDQLNALCFQCHLHGVGRVAHYGLTDFSFQPGDRLSDVWTIFVESEGTGTGDAATQGEQMLSSRCFLESKGKMTCISCHDPHRSPLPEQRTDFYRSQCIKCHDSSIRDCVVPEADRLQASPDDSCIQCHMPRIEANNVPHTALTDHRILRNPQATPKQKKAEQSKRSLVVFDNQDGNISEDEVARARGIIAVRQAESSSNRVLAASAIEALLPWVRTFPDDTAAAEALGSAYQLTYNLDAARSVWESALIRTPKSEQLLLHLTLLCHDNGDLKNGIKYGRRLIDVNPWHSEYLGRLAHMLGQAGMPREGIPFALRAAELSPWDFQIHGWLAETFQIVGDQVKAEHHRAMYNKLKPVNQ